MDKKYFVYMHISPSNKRYIGVTCRKKVEQRWGRGSGYKEQKYFYRAIQKYGWDNFQHIIIAKGITEEEAKWLETEMIKCWNSNNRNYGYNQTAGGDGLKGHIFTEEHKQKLRKLKLGDKNPRYGLHYTEEEKEER